MLFASGNALEDGLRDPWINDLRPDCRVPPRDLWKLAKGYAAIPTMAEAKCANAAESRGVDSLNWVGKAKYAN